jgi:putative two-component system response regulator
MAYDVARAHHERFDGSGYPAGLRAEEIPLSARIVAIADQYDALRNKRPYKDPFDAKKTYRILTEGDERSSPRHLDPGVLAAFESGGAEEFDAIFEELKEPEVDVEGGGEVTKEEGGT